MDSNQTEEQIQEVEKEILEACQAIHPEALRSWEADLLWSRVGAITRDDRPYALGGQLAFFEALDRLRRRGCVAVNRGAGGMFEARITPDGISELEIMKNR